MNKQKSMISWLAILGLSLVCTSRCFAEPGIQLRTFPVGKALGKLHLLWRDAAGKNLATLAAAHAHLRAQGLTPVVLMNAGIFGLDHAPLGLHVADGKELRGINRRAGQGNFYLAPNGVFSISPDQKTARIQATEDYLDGQPSLAVQSGPLLVREGKLHPQFTQGSTFVNVRNGIGVTKDGLVVLAISRERVNLFDFATAFRDVLHCPNALYLDGSISQVWQEGESLEKLEPQRFAGILAIVQ